MALAAPKPGTVFEGRCAKTHGPRDPLVYSYGNDLRDMSELANIVKQLPGLQVQLGHDGPIVGRVMAGRIDGDHAIAEMVITDQRALHALKMGTKELSLGYRCERDDRGYQRKIELQELSIVDSARCGPSCEVRTDHCCSACEDAQRLQEANDRIAALAAGVDRFFERIRDANRTDEERAADALKDLYANAWWRNT